MLFIFITCDISKGQGFVPFYKQTQRNRQQKYLLQRVPLFCFDRFEIPRLIAFRRFKANLFVKFHGGLFFRLNHQANHRMLFQQALHQLIQTAKVDATQRILGQQV